MGRCAAVITLVASVNLASTALTITTWRDWTTEASWLVRCATRNVTGHHVFFNPLRSRPDLVNRVDERTGALRKAVKEASREGIWSQTGLDLNLAKTSYGSYQLQVT